MLGDYYHPFTTKEKIGLGLFAVGVGWALYKTRKKKKKDR